MANNINGKNYINVYFIENHLREVKLKLYFKDDEKQFYDSLKIEDTLDFKKQQNEIYEISIYSFKVYNTYLNEKIPKQKKMLG